MLKKYIFTLLALILAAGFSLSAPAAESGQAAARPIPLPGLNEIAQGGSWDELNRTFSPGLAKEALAILDSVRAVDLSEFENRSDLLAAGGGEPELTIWFSTKGRLYDYTYSFSDDLLCVGTGEGNTKYFGKSQSIAAAKEKLHKLAQSVPPTLPDMNGELYLINDREKTAAWCDSEASEALGKLCKALSCSGAAQLPPRTSGVVAIESKTRYKTRYELGQNGLHASWWSTDQPLRELYPAMNVSFPQAQWNAFLVEIDRQYARCEKAPLWLAMINPAKIIGARVYSAKDQQLFSSDNPDSIEPKLSRVRVKAGSYQKVEDTAATLSGANRIEVDFIGGIRYKLLFNETTLMIFSSDLDYGARYTLTEEGARALEHVRKGGFPYNPSTGG